MAELTWGKFTHQYCKYTSDAPDNDWKELDAPKDGTTKVEEQEGEEVVAKEEGGAIVATRRGETNVTATFSLFVKDNKDLPFEGKRGQIPGEYAWRLKADNKEAYGVIIKRASISAKIEYASAEGIMVTYTIKGLKPASGDILELKKTKDIV